MPSVYTAMLADGASIEESALPEVKASIEEGQYDVVVVIEGERAVGLNLNRKGGAAALGSKDESVPE